MNTEKNLIQSFGGGIDLLLELIAAFCLGEVNLQLLQTNRPRSLVEEGNSR
jgi:hypothetical protein